MKATIQLIKNDALRYEGGVIKSYLFRPTFRVVFWYRVICNMKTRKFMKYSIGLLVYIIFRYLEYKYGIFINTNIRIGPGLYIEHGGCLYLNASYIGNNFTVFHEVTLGTTHKGGKPYVGNNVTCYMGAKVIGNVCLGDGSVVGANAVVTKNIPLGAVVVGVPAKQINKSNLSQNE